MDIKTFRDQTAIERNLRSNATNINLVAFRADEEQLYVNDLRADDSALDTVYNMLGISKRYARKLPLRLMMPHIEYQARNVDKIVHMVSLNDALVGFSYYDYTADGNFASGKGYDVNQTNLIDNIEGFY